MPASPTSKHDVELCKARGRQMRQIVEYDMQQGVTCKAAIADLALHLGIQVESVRFALLLAGFDRPYV